MNWTEALMQFLLGVAPAIVAFLISYYLKEKAKQEALMGRLNVVAYYADLAVKAAEDLLGPKQGVLKLKKAVEILRQFLEKLGVYLSDEEAEAEIRKAFQESEYAKKKEAA